MLMGATKQYTGMQVRHLHQRQRQRQRRPGRPLLSLPRRLLPHLLRLKTLSRWATVVVSARGRARVCVCVCQQHGSINAMDTNRNVQALPK